MNRVFFIVTCIGHSASKWLAASLSRHPDIICSHGAGRPSIALVHDRDYEVTERILIAEDEQKRPREMSLDSVFSELEEQGQADAYGNVHMFTVPSLKRSIARKRPQVRFKIANLIRHPVSWVESGTYNYLEQLQFNPDYEPRVRERVFRQRGFWESIIKTHKVDVGLQEVQAFLCSVFAIRAMRADFLALPLTSHIQMERITKDPELYKAVVRWLTQGRVEVSANYIDEVFAHGKVNVHNKKGKRSPAEIFACWEKWKRELLAKAVRQTEIDELYGQLGYDLTFVTESDEYKNTELHGWQPSHTKQRPLNRLKHQINTFGRKCVEKQPGPLRDGMLHLWEEIKIHREVKISRQKCEELTSQQNLRLNLSLDAGHAKEGWVNVYQFDDRVGDVVFSEQPDTLIVPYDFRTELPLRDEACEFVYCFRLLEQMNRSQAVELLQECQRVLQRDGTLRLALSNYKALAEACIRGHLKYVNPSDFVVLDSNHAVLNAEVSRPRNVFRETFFTEQDIILDLEVLGFKEIVLSKHDKQYDPSDYFSQQCLFYVTARKG